MFSLYWVTFVPYTWQSKTHLFDYHAWYQPHNTRISLLHVVPTLQSCVRNRERKIRRQKNMKGRDEGKQRWEREGMTEKIWLPFLAARLMASATFSLTSAVVGMTSTCIAVSDVFSSNDISSTSLNLQVTTTTNTEHGQRCRSKWIRTRTRSVSIQTGVFSLCLKCSQRVRSWRLLADLRPLIN